MSLESQVQVLLNQVLVDHPSLFLIESKIQANNSIEIIIDGDNGVTVDDCIAVSRAIEHNLDREEQDFSLEVTSAGATSPLQHVRQYKKNIGRTLDVKVVDNQKFEGQLALVDAEGVTLKWKGREPKPIGKGKVTVEKEQKLLYNDIIEAKVKIKF